MKMADLIGHCSITEFQKILKSDNFSKNEIEDFLKANPDCSDIYIKEITMYVCEKYKNEINIYLEIAKCYLNRNTDESIKYLEIYKSNGGNNQDALILLMKLYRNIGKLNKALEIAGSINCDNNREAIEEVFVWMHVERRRFFAVEWTQALIVAARFAQLHVLTNHGNDVSARANLSDGVVGDCHTLF